MIFVTIGSMFPFDRMIRAVDAWAGARPEASEPMLAQIGAGAYEPRNMQWVRRLERAEYARTVAGARLIVAHAGVGSVVSAGEAGKPIVVLARRHDLGEHTSDHQMETAGWLREKPGVHVAGDEAQIAVCIEAAGLGSGAGSGAGQAPIPTAADPAFIARIRDFIAGGNA